MNRLLIFLLAVAGLASWAVPAHADDWPSKPITFLQPYGPGTALDATARYIGNQLALQWKVPVVMNHRAGANGVIGTEAAARSAPDGYTFLFTGPGHFTNELMMAKVPFDPVRDFVPVAKIASVMLVLSVPKGSPFTSVRELLEYARANPGKLSYASGGNGSSQHLSAAAFLAQAGVSALHVPYKTQTQALTDTVSGQVSFSFVAMATAAAQIGAGNLRALAVTGPRRSQTLPEVPTLAEAGLPGYEFFSFNAVFAPAGTPPEIVKKFSDALVPIVRSPGFAELIRAQMIENDFADAREWAAAIPAERRRWADVVKASGARQE